MYGYEEALGYCVDPDAVRDKDGIAAAVLACDLAATLKAAGRGLPDRLDELAVAPRRAPAPRGCRCAWSPPHGTRPSARLRDGSAGGLVERAARAGRAGAAPRAGERLVVRPSGTEPKLKAYLEVVEPVPDAAALHTARAAAQARLDALRAEVSTLLGVVP